LKLLAKLPRRVQQWIFLGVCVVSLALAAPLWLPLLGYWLAMRPNPQPADAIAVFGGNHERTLLATELYRQGFAPEVWQTGWSIEDSQQAGITGDANRELLATVPPDALMLVETESTWEDAQVMVHLAREQNAASIVVITNWFHSRRALCSLHKQQAGAPLRVYYAPVAQEDAVPGSTPANWWQSREGRRLVRSEYIKMGYYALRYGVLPWGC
jgi:uncharacterized SAM-binding protein YcdF (DUF218 family)